MASPLDSLLVFDLGLDQWACGWASESGPSEIMPAAAADDRDLRTRLHAVFMALDATPAECAVLLCEPAGTTDERRDALAAALFACGVPLLWAAAAPRLALFYSERETATLVDICGTRAFVLPVYCGHACLDCATEHPLDDDEACGLHEAVLQTVDLVDVSLRAALLAAVVVVGSGAREEHVAQRLRERLDSSVLARDPRWKRRHWPADAAPSGATLRPPCAPRVVANADRILGAWLGAAAVGALSSAQSRFLTRAAAAKEPAALRQRSLPLRCRSLAAQLEENCACAAAEAAAEERARRLGQEAASAAAEEARAWRLEAAAACAEGADERRAARQRAMRAASEWWRWQRAVKRRPPAPPPGLFAPAAEAALRRRFAPPSHPPPAAALLGAPLAPPARPPEGAFATPLTSLLIERYLYGAFFVAALRPERWPWEPAAAVATG